MYDARRRNLVSVFAFESKWREMNIILDLSAWILNSIDEIDFLNRAKTCHFNIRHSLGVYQ